MIHPSGMARSSSAARNTFIIDTAPEVMSKPSHPPARGTAIDQGFTPRRRSAPPHGATNFGPHAPSVIMRAIIPWRAAIAV